MPPTCHCPLCRRCSHHRIQDLGHSQLYRLHSPLHRNGAGVGTLYKIVFICAFRRNPQCRRYWCGLAHCRSLYFHLCLPGITDNSTYVLVSRYTTTVVVILYPILGPVLGMAHNATDPFFAQYCSTITTGSSYS